MSADDRLSEELFDDLLAGIRGTIDAEIADELAIIEPDFPAVIDELRRRDDGLLADDVGPELSPAWGAASRSGCSNARISADPADDPLFGLISDARHEIEADLAARRLLPVPPLPQPNLDRPAETATSPAPAGLRWVGAALAVAATVALLWGLGPSLARPLLGGSPTPSQAQWSERDDAEPGLASTRAPEPERPRRTARTRGAAPSSAATPENTILDDVADDAIVDDAIVDDAIADEPEDADGTQPSQEAASDPKGTPKPAEASASEGSEGTTKARGIRDLDALEAEAEDLWRAGDRAGAEALLRKIIRLSRARRRADLAYGDLFTITRQLYGREREAEVWREYLARFPRGRYADDARAGLCRRESASEARACWSRYMLDFPSGTHRDEAGRTTDAD